MDDHKTAALHSDRLAQSWSINKKVDIFEFVDDNKKGCETIYEWKIKIFMELCAMQFSDSIYAVVAPITLTGPVDGAFPTFPSRPDSAALYTVHSTVQCTLYSTLYTLQYTVHSTVHCTLYSTIRRVSEINLFPTNPPLTAVSASMVK